MERITIKQKDGGYSFAGENFSFSKQLNTMSAALERLAEFENVGMTPEELARMKEESLQKNVGRVLYIIIENANIRPENEEKQDDYNTTERKAIVYITPSWFEAEDMKKKLEKETDKKKVKTVCDEIVSGEDRLWYEILKVREQKMQDVLVRRTIELDW